MVQKTTLLVAHWYVYHVVKNEFVQSFDEYLYASEMTREQDPKTGEITLTCKSDENTKWVVTLLPPSS